MTKERSFIRCKTKNVIKDLVKREKLYSVLKVSKNERFAVVNLFFGMTGMPLICGESPLLWWMTFGKT